MTRKLTLRDTRRLIRARNALQQQRLDEAIRIYRDLSSRHPHRPELQLELAKAILQSGQLANADHELALIAIRFSDSGAVLVAVGRIYDSMRMFDRAAAVYQTALGMSLSKADRIRACTSLAATCERENDVDGAQQHVAVLLDLAPNAAETLLMAGIVASRNDQLSDAEAFLKQASKADLIPLLKARAAYELANVLDRQGHYQLAFDVVSDAKQIMLPGRSAALAMSDRVAKVTKRLAQIIEPRHFQQWAAAARAPSNEAMRGTSICLLTGHPRSGTTLLEQMLTSHPQVASADESSSLLHSLFTPLVGNLQSPPPDERLLLENVDQQEIDNGRLKYIRTLARRAFAAESPAVDGKTNDPRDAGQTSWLIDKNPEAIVMLPVLQRSVPEAKVIVVVRDPRDVCLSCYLQFLPATPVSVNYLTLQKTAEKYARTMKLWLAIRPHLKLQWREIKYEELVTDPVTVLNGAVDLLQIKFDPQMLMFADTAAARTIRSPSYRTVVNQLHQHSIGRWRNYRKQFATVAEILKPFVAEFGYEESSYDDWP